MQWQDQWTDKSLRHTKLCLRTGAGSCPRCCWGINPDSPSILEQRHQETDSRAGVAHKLTIRHIHTADCPAIHSIFFIRNLTVHFTSLTLPTAFSLSFIKEGNSPALCWPGPGIGEICPIWDSEAKKASHFWTSFFSFLKFYFILLFF